MALYTGAATYRTESDGALKLTGSGVQLTHAAAAARLADALIADAAQQAVGEIVASITEDTPSGSPVIFSAWGSVDSVLAALKQHRAATDAN